MNYDDDIESDIQKTKLLSGMGCLLWAIILTVLILAPIVYYVGKFIYAMEYKETTLVVSKSPNQQHTIKVVEVGEPAFFGPSKVRIKYENHYIDRSISNDGATLHPSNVSVNWKNDREATITLDGDEQDPETVEFKLEPNKNKNPLQVAIKELGFITFQTSVSPNNKNMIEFRRNSKGSTSYDSSSPIRVYYGVKETELTAYKEFQAKDIESYDHFEIYWSGDTYVMIDAIGKNQNGIPYVMDSVRINMNDKKQN